MARIIGWTDGEATYCADCADFLEIPRGTLTEVLVGDPDARSACAACKEDIDQIEVRRSIESGEALADWKWGRDY